jgi:hypothetical protein
MSGATNLGGEEMSMFNVEQRHKAVLIRALRVERETVVECIADEKHLEKFRAEFEDDLDCVNEMLRELETDGS